LIHLEQQWQDNHLTVLGDLFHERVHSGEREWRDGRLLIRSLRLVSYTLGLSGQADLVEFCKTEQSKGAVISGIKGEWLPFPVEYKKGKPKADNIDEVQLCAQAICLEEQLSVNITEGALYYGAEKKRHSVLYTPELRSKTIQLAESLHKLMKSGKTPVAVYAARCKSCSLIEICQPKWAGLTTKAKYEAMLFEEPQ
jgi:CRISPR-associated exonuclease Cas4